MAEPPYPRTPAQQEKALRETLRLASDLADALSTQATRVKRQCAELEAALAQMPALPDAAPAPDDGAPAQAADAGSPSEESPARLAAMEMAIQGATRGEIETYLRENLRVTETQEMLDEVLRGADA